MPVQPLALPERPRWRELRHPVHREVLESLEGLCLRGRSL